DQMAGTKPARVDFCLGAEKPGHQLFLAHFEREDGDSGFFLRVNGRMLPEIQRKSRLTHRWPSGHDNQVTLLETGCHPVQIDEPCRNAGNMLLFLIKLFNGPDRGPDQILDMVKSRAELVFGNLEYRFLGTVQQLFDIGLFIETLGDDIRSSGYQAS